MTALSILLCAAALFVLPARHARIRVLRTKSGRTVDQRSKTLLRFAVGAAGAGAVASLGGAHLLCASGIVAATLWARLRTAGIRRTHRAELESLTAGLETVVGELRVGAHPAAASAAAASECTGTVADAFARASGRARLGGTAHDGLRNADSPVATELAIVAAAWCVADERGLALVGLLSAARGDMIARNRFRDRTQAALAGARATGTVLACLPVLGVGLGQAMGAAPLSVLLGGGLGGILLVIGCAFVCAGLLWTDAITAKVCR
ncbi:MAG: type II secretion system F family protein [Rhodococcus sp. (in: high G+C Gram-positive bacteria)]